MKKTIIALSIGTFFGTAFATVGTVAVTGTGSNTVTSSTASGSYVLGVGTSRSTASNTQTATAYIGGAGSVTSKPSNAFVTIGDCSLPVKVSGTQLTGHVNSFGGTSATGKSTAQNISTGTGTGATEAIGSSVAQVVGKTTLTSPNMNLNAGGTAFSGVVTKTGAIGTNGSASSTGATSSAFNATANGSLFTYRLPNGTVGDVKSIVSNTYTRVGGIPTVTPGHCGSSNCVTGPSVVTGGAIVEGGATANAGGNITATITRP